MEGARVGEVDMPKEMVNLPIAKETRTTRRQRSNQMYSSQRNTTPALPGS